MDIFTEQIVRKTSTGKDTLLKVLIGVIALLLALTIFLVSSLFGMSFIGIVIAGLVIYLGFYLLTGFDVEYEYIVTNGEIDIDKIIAKRKRKRLVTARVSTFEKFGLVKDAEPLSGATTIIASGIISDDDYYADFKHSKHGQVRLIFSPNEKVIDGIRPFLPRNLR